MRSWMDLEPELVWQASYDPGGLEQRHPLEHSLVHSWMALEQVLGLPTSCGLGG